MLVNPDFSIWLQRAAFGLRGYAWLSRALANERRRYIWKHQLRRLWTGRNEIHMAVPNSQSGAVADILSLIPCACRRPSDSTTLKGGLTRGSPEAQRSTSTSLPVIQRTGPPFISALPDNQYLVLSPVATTKEKHGLDYTFWHFISRVTNGHLCRIWTNTSVS